MNRPGFLISALVLALAGTSSRAEIIYGMQASSSASAALGIGIVRFDSATPGTLTTVGTFSGATAGHTVRAIDFRPATGQLYAISSDTATGTNAQLYTVDLTTAALTPVGTGFALGNNTSNRLSLDFNPAVDRIRIVTGATAASGQNNNFRAHPDTGALVTTNDTNLAYAAGDPGVGVAYSITATAYSNNNPGGVTTLFAWDFNTDSLLTIGGPNGTPSPNDGALFSVNRPTVFLTAGGSMGMDISGLSNILYVAHDDPGTGTITSLFTRDLVTGVENTLGAFPTGTFVTAISVQPIPEPGSLALCGLGAACLGRYIRRRKAK